MIKLSRFFVALFFLCFALSASAAKENPEDCTPYDLVGQWLFNYGLIPGRAFPKIKFIDSQVLGKTTGKGEEKYYDAGEIVKQYTHLITYPSAKKGGDHVKVLVISECAENTVDAAPLVYLISPVYMRFNILDADDADSSILNSRNAARKELQKKIKEVDKKLDELGKEQ